MARVKQLKEIASIIAEDKNMHIHAVEEIIKSQFKYVEEHLKSGSTYPVRLINLGVFVVKKRFRDFQFIKDYFTVHGHHKEKLSQ